MTEGSTTNVELESCLSADWEYLRGSRTAFVGSTIEVFAKSFDFSRELGMVSWLPHGASTSCVVDMGHRSNRLGSGGVEWIPERCLRHTDSS